MNASVSRVEWRTSSGAARAWLATLDHPLTADLLTRLDRFESLVGTAVAACPLVLPADESSLVAWTPRAWGLKAGGWCRLFLERWRTAPQALQPAIQACLLRAWRPFGGLITCPLSDLFWPDEIDQLTAARQDMGEIEVTRLNLRAGTKSVYRGYLCVILKVTRLCNLRCTYCHDWSDAPQDHSQFHLILRAVGQALQLGKGTVDFVLHGGEPLMLGRRGMLRLLAIQAHLAQGGQTVHNHLQTNGTLLDAAWLDVLETFGIRASVSIDGPREVHDRSRPDALGRGTFDRAMHGLELLRSRHLLSGVLMVVTAEVLARGADALHASLQALGLLDVGLIPQRPAAGETGGIAHAAFVRFLVDFEHSARAASAAGQTRVHLRELDAVQQLVSGKPSGFCELGGNCVGAFISIEADGRVSHCDKYTGDATYVYGNLFETDLGDLLRSERAQSIARRADAGLTRLRACRHFALCQGGCPHERYLQPSGEQGTCCGMGPLFDLFEAPALRPLAAVVAGAPT
ncbi:radical SAM/SPASM domain-containing protein [Roseateles amylovorans]|uniref:Radical SAM protein n=1 Tax=Roseateles amylovorans TaxID=2978473 RepID=A0ABY6ATW0_9BURK|nr:radical SAM protein [Roseateles amylovorans]UXH76373.1 radical SAM protein [Roseateles amylovorans]